MSFTYSLIVLLVVLVIAWLVWATFRVLTLQSPRRDRRTGQVYTTYLDWLRDDRFVFIFIILIGYVYYVMTTDPS